MAKPQGKKNGHLNLESYITIWKHRYRIRKSVVTVLGGEGQDWWDTVEFSSTLLRSAFPLCFCLKNLGRNAHVEFTEVDKDAKT